MFNKNAIYFAIAIILPFSAFGQSTTSGTFSVDVTLTSKCELSNGSSATSVINNLALSYTSFQTTASIGKTSFNVRCTDGLLFSLKLDSATITDGTTGLNYTLHLSDQDVTSAIANLELTGRTGKGAGELYYIHGNIAANQSGISKAGTANKGRTITITY